MRSRCNDFRFCAEHRVCRRGMRGSVRLLFVTHDLADDNCHLQPWRTICEAVGSLRRIGVEADLVSLGGATLTYSAAGIPEGTTQLSKRTADFERVFRDHVRSANVDLMLWPLSWRQPRRRVSAVTGIGVPVVCYFPGGVYNTRSALVAASRIGREAGP